MSGRRIAICILLVGVVSVLSFVLHRHTNVQERGATTTAGKSEPNVSGVAQSGKDVSGVEIQRNWVAMKTDSIATNAPFVAMPPINTPVAEVVRQLRVSAESGNPQAACRLGIELTRCWHTDRLLNVPYIKERSSTDEIEFR